MSCTGSCTFQWNYTGYILIEQTCEFGCSCPTPPSNYSGDTLVLQCGEVSDVISGCLLICNQNTGQWESHGCEPGFICENTYYTSNYLDCRDSPVQQVAGVCRPDVGCYWACAFDANGYLNWILISNPCPGGYSCELPPYPCGYYGQIIGTKCVSSNPFCIWRCNVPDTIGQTPYWELILTSYTGNCECTKPNIPCSESFNHDKARSYLVITQPKTSNRQPTTCIKKCIYNGTQYIWVTEYNGCGTCGDYICPDPDISCNACREGQSVTLNCKYTQNLRNSLGIESGKKCTYFCNANNEWQLIHSDCDNYTCAQNFNIYCNYSLYENLKVLGYFDLGFIHVPCGFTETAKCNDYTCAYVCTETGWSLLSGCLGSCYCPQPEIACGSGCIGALELVKCTGSTYPTTSTTTPAPPDCSRFGCRWRCNGYLAWELLSSNCTYPCVCAEPTEACTAQRICEEVLVPCVLGTTTTAAPTTTTTTVRPAPRCQDYICRWFCTYTNTGFSWVQTQACPTGCACGSPTVECGPENACKYVASRCNPATTSTTLPPAPCGRCSYICYGNEYILYDNSCTGSCICPSVSGSCIENDILTLNCVESVTTTSTTTSTTTTTTQAPTYPEGYCTYRCIDGYLLNRIFSSCSEGYICNERVYFICDTGKLYNLKCSTTGEYAEVLTNIDILLNIASNLNVLVSTTPAPNILNLNSPLDILVQILSELNIPLPTTTTLKPCVGDCRYVWLGYWYLLSHNCSCACIPPAQAGTEELEERSGYCVPGVFVTTQLPEWEPTSTPPVVDYPTTTSTTTPNPAGYPNGYCKYLCTFYAYVLDRSTCIDGYTCDNYIIQMSGCEPGSITYLACKPQ